MTKSNKRARVEESTEKAFNGLPVIVVENNDDSPIGQVGNLLTDLLSPLTSHDFLSSYFGKKSVHVQAKHGEKRVMELCNRLFDLDTESILQNTSSENIFVWLQTSTNERHIRSIEVSDPSVALALYHAGHATYCRAPPELESDLVSALLDQTGLGCGQYDPSGESSTCLGRGEIEVFISSKTGHQTNWHYDFQENYTIQLSGVKQWTLQECTVTNPLRACTPHYHSPESVEPQLKAARLSDPRFEFGPPQIGKNARGKSQTVTLHPGDVLYFPAGMWHKIDVIEPGVSVNISLMATHYASLTCQALQHVLLKKESWRQCVVNNSAVNAVDQLKKLLKELPGIICEIEAAGGAEAILPAVQIHGRLSTPPLNRSESPTSDESSSNSEMSESEISSKSDEVLRPPYAFITCPGPYRKSYDELVRDLETSTLCLNPLANIMLHKSVTEYYFPNNDGTNNDNVYIINIGYAGNELQESPIRFMICDNSNILKCLIGSGLSNEKWVTLLKDSENQKLVDILVYHGCLVWVPKVVLHHKSSSSSKRSFKSTSA
jgi:hypothetical protein